MVEARYIGGRAPGQGRYALAEMVGRGGFATVWRAEAVEEPGGARRSLFGGKSRAGGREVAVKVIPVYSAGERSRALREGQIASGLRHPNIVETLEVIPGDTEVYLVTEFVRGMPLDEAARHYTINEVVDSLAQILEALAYAHAQGVIHRDIKPQNALVDARGRVKLTDFGVAFRIGDTRLTQVGYAVGTPGYIAPEVLDGEDPTELTDIYAVGATARAMLSRQPEEPPPRLRELVDRSTSPNPAHRPRSAEAALKLLTGRRELVAARSSERKVAAFSGGLASHVLRGVNGLVAAWLGYEAAGLLLNDVGSLGVAAGLGVLGYLLPRLAALGVIVALAVALQRNGQVGSGFWALLPGLGMVWVAASFADRGARLAPLSPLISIPLAALPLVPGGLGAGVPLLFGAFMRPLGAILCSTLAAILLVGHDIVFGDGVLPYLGVDYGPVPLDFGPARLLEKAGRVVEVWPPLLMFFALWAAMAAIVSLARWIRRPLLGVIFAILGGALAYAVLSGLPGGDPGAFTEAMISLGVAGIIIFVARYLGARARG